MIKYFFIVLNSISLFVFSLFSGDEGITLTHTIPARMVAGQEVAIELKINKGGMSGFAKLQIELPEGVLIKESEEKGANYNYSLGMAKWVWAALPMESEIVVKLVLYVEESAIGPKTISARYSYVENNVKQVVEMEPAEVTILEPGSAIDAPMVATTEPTVSTLPAASTETLNTHSAIEPPNTMSIERTISAGTSPNEFLIGLKIKKGNTKGFARFSDDVNENITVNAVKTDGGSFSVADGKLKFVWVNVPEKEELDIAYTITGNTSEAVMLGGEYSYLEDNQSKKCKAGMETISFQTSQLSSNSKTNEPEPVTIPDPETKVPATVESVEETIAKKLANTNMQTFGEKNTAKMVYYVQVGAFKSAKIKAQKLKKKFKINEPINSEMHEGYSKFMVGSHTEYKNARDHRETMQTTNGVKSAFVVAYNQGKRITVQEGLMITNQKWYK